MSSEKLSNIITQNKEQLHGVKILYFIPFFVKYITVRTHVKMCAIRAKMTALQGSKEVNINDFYNAEKQSVSSELIMNYCLIGLLNDRMFSFLYRPFLKRKLSKCTYKEIHGIYSKLLELSEPAFFLGIWTHSSKADHTLLKEEKHS